MGTGNDQTFCTRGVIYTLDPTPAQERLLRSYAGAARFAYNWAVGEVSANLSVRRAQHEAGVAEADLAPALSWSAYGLSKCWNESKIEVAPWWQEVSMHAFRSGLSAAAGALGNFSASKKGERKGKRVGFPHRKSRRRSVPSVSFVELNHQLSWLNRNRHGVRLMLPQSTPDPDVKLRRQHLGWIHTTESTRRLYNLVESGRATIQKVTISYRGGRWQAAFSVRHLVTPAVGPQARGAAERVVGLDAGLMHLATLSVPVLGLTDANGHVANPAVLTQHLRRLKKLDRAIARCERGSRNRTRLLKRRARLDGTITKTRAFELHRVTNDLVRRFGVIGIEDLNLVGMGSRKGRLGRSVADASLGELRRQLTYKTTDRRLVLVVIDRYHPSSKTCSSCGSVKAKLDRGTRIFECEPCGAVLDRDINAARNIAREAVRLLEQQKQTFVAGLRPETQNADPRPRKTRGAHAPTATAA
ncbi:MAG TPA: RNA-guided endonuclease TnpB family protein [Acidimicrobiales bacterium]|nr:RNA-guided endonuclease TnpB family protein [Acidimicrobiales bacterium]